MLAEVQLAQECGMTVLGFVRDNRLKVHAGSGRAVVLGNWHTSL